MRKINSKIQKLKTRLLKFLKVNKETVSTNKNFILIIILYCIIIGRECFKGFSGMEILIINSIIMWIICSDKRYILFFTKVDSLIFHKLEKPSVKCRLTPVLEIGQLWYYWLTRNYVDMYNMVVCYYSEQLMEKRKNLLRVIFINMYSI